MAKTYSDYFPPLSEPNALADPRFAAYAPAGAGLPVGDDSGLPGAEKVSAVSRILEQKIHGICFSPYLAGQGPGSEITQQQIRERLAIIQPYCRWIRTFSCREGNQSTPIIAHEMGLKTMVGISLGEDHDKNDIEFENGIRVARSGHADILAVGNEVLLRGDMSEADLLNFIQRARQAAPGVPVGYVDAYFLFEQHPKLVDACDVILINCYPFWESCPADFAPRYMQDMVRRAQAAAKGKPVIISETGWPSFGNPYGAALPGYHNAVNYFIETYRWAEQAGVEVFYFSSFDESWKVGDEGDVGAYWGLWDQDGALKYTQ